MTRMKIEIAPVLALGLLLGDAPDARALDCTNNASITKVQYVGRDAGKDNFLVEWTRTGDDTACVTCNGQKLSLNITRKLGHTDSTSVTVNCAQTSRILSIDRGPLETDPQSYVMKIDVENGQGLTNGVPVQFTALGPPEGSNLSIAGPSNACNLGLEIYKLGFLTNEPNKDVAEVFWRLLRQPDCSTITAFEVTVELRRANGDFHTKKVTVSPSTLGTRVDLPEGGTVTSSKVVVRALTKLTAPLSSTSKTGNF